MVGKVQSDSEDEGTENEPAEMRATSEWMANDKGKAHGEVREQNGGRSVRRQCVLPYNNSKRLHRLRQHSQNSLN